MKNKKGFTLIELLVVISIIALLLSILMPSLQKVKEQAQKVVCGSNMRQMGIALALYAASNDDYAAAKSSQSTIQPWDSAIAAYFSTNEKDADKKYLKCPADKKFRDIGNWGSSGFDFWFNFAISESSTILPRSYCISAAIRNSTAALMHGFGPLAPTNPIERNPAKYSQVFRPTKTIHVVEQQMGSDHPWCVDSVAPFGGLQGSNAWQEALKPSIPGVELLGEIDQEGQMHKTGGNWLFVDGRVEWHKFTNAISYAEQLFEGLEYPYNWQWYRK